MRPRNQQPTANSQRPTTNNQQPTRAVGFGALAVTLLWLSGLGIAAAPFELNVGDLLLANYSENNVLKLDVASRAQQNLGSFDTPTDVALSTSGDLYVSEWGGSVWHLNLTNGSRRILNPGSALRQVWGLTLGPAGEILVTSRANHSVVSIHPDTGAEELISQGDHLSGPIGIALLDPGHVVVASLFNNEVVSVSLNDGTQSALAGGAAGIDQPWGVAVRGTEVFVSAYDQKLIQRITGGTVATFYTCAGFPYGLAIQPAGALAVGTSGTTDIVLRLSPAGTLIDDFSGGSIGQVTGLEISLLHLVADSLTNTPPMLEAVPDQTVTAGSTLSLWVAAADNDWPPQTLTFSLDAGAPPGAAITPLGLLTWTPTAAPAQTPITVRVTDNGDPSLSATTTFGVTVTENVAPRFEGIPVQTVYAGHRLETPLRVIDPDVPPQGLTYRLAPGSAPGATVSADGVFTWTPPVADSATTNEFTVTVEDSGMPPLADSATFAVIVSPPATVVPGDILVACWGANEVIRLDPTSGAQQRLGVFDTPTDVALGWDDRIYVCEWSGIIKWLNLTNGVSGVVNPDTAMVEAWALTSAPDGMLYVASAGDEGVVRLDPRAGTETLVSSSNLISGPFGLDLLDPGHLVVGSIFNNALVSVAIADGSQTLLLQESGLDQPWGIASQGAQVFITAYGPGTVQRFTQGALGEFYATAGTPYGIATATNGSVIVGVGGADQAVLELDAQGNLLRRYEDGLISEPTGLEVFRVLPPPVVPPVLWSSAAATAGYQPDAAATVDSATRTITTRRAGSLQFYQLESSAELRITQIDVAGEQVTITYEP